MAIKTDVETGSSLTQRSASFLCISTLVL